jgi:hypothetical protein
MSDRTPEKKRIRNLHYSGKKRRYTKKVLVAVDKANNRIICTAFGKGRTHDFRLFKESKLHTAAKTLSVADSGFTGIVKIHPNSLIPLKGTKKRPLSQQDKFYNRVISMLRASNEHIIGRVKRFRILSERYRNRRRRFVLRFNLIAGICNFELA